MPGTIAGLLVDINMSNGHRESLAASFVADLEIKTLDAVVTGFDGPGEAPVAVHWRAAAPCWIVVTPAERVDTGPRGHDYLDLPKLIFPQQFPPLAESVVGGGRVSLSAEAAQLLGNGRAARVIADVDPSTGVIRRYQTERADGTVLRVVALHVVEMAARSPNG